MQRVRYAIPRCNEDIQSKTKHQSFSSSPSHLFSTGRGRGLFSAAVSAATFSFSRAFNSSCCRRRSRACAGSRRPVFFLSPAASCVSPPPRPTLKADYQPASQRLESQATGVPAPAPAYPPGPCPTEAEDEEDEEAALEEEEEAASPDDGEPSSEARCSLIPAARISLVGTASASCRSSKSISTYILTFSQAQARFRRQQLLSALLLQIQLLARGVRSCSAIGLPETSGELLLELSFEEEEEKGSLSRRAPEAVNATLLIDLLLQRGTHRPLDLFAFLLPQGTHFFSKSRSSISSQSSRSRSRSGLRDRDEEDSEISGDSDVSVFEILVIFFSETFFFCRACLFPLVSEESGEPAFFFSPSPHWRRSCFSRDSSENASSSCALTPSSSQLWTSTQLFRWFFLQPSPFDWLAGFVFLC